MQMAYYLTLTTHIQAVSTCHDLKEILWVPNFYYVSNMLSTIGVEELRLCS